MDNRELAREYIHKLYNLLNKRKDNTSELLDITDVLLQVYKKLDTVENPEALVNRLVNYIRSMALKGRIYFPSTEEHLMIELGVIGQKAGLNGLYKADYSDKSQFYSYSELSEMPRR
ncbi:bacteriocin immunity protein [Enterococcus faecalis]|uniref:bacteriocin immunity protein n=1 Tax=Enterococcus faecalis TaxID=1351 RepID=UPI001A0D1D28|nr:bacteriocin immunity protein [Enterococcus faecalis]EGO9277175.1 bacteriocin immunity protein [Enterococcus faecalis]